MPKTPLYNYIDIQRYLQHKMSSQEMHEFERALMNDSFLADAMEGFSTVEASLAERHLQEIETLITGEQQKAKVVPLTAQKTVWWRVAAVILLVVSAGAITYSVLNNSNSLNKNKDQIAASSPATGSIEKDSLRPADKPLARADIFRETQPLDRQKSSSPMIRHHANNASTIKKAEAEVAEWSEKKKELNTSLADSFAVASLPQSRRPYPEALKFRVSPVENPFPGKVVDKSGTPLPGAS
ncbi:MAG: hypothetical protein ACR2KZ_14040, partial [Segetibacter sp.]